MPEQDQEKTEKKIEEKFAFAPGSSQTALDRYHAQRRKQAEYYPTNPSYRDYDPSKAPRISLVTEQFPERSVRHVYRSGGKRKPTLTLPADWAIAMGIDYINPKNGNNTVLAEFSADKESIVIRRMRPPIEMSQPVDYELFAVDSDAEAQAAEEENDRKKN